MNSRYKDVFALESVQFDTRNNAFAFSLKDRTGTSHHFKCDPDTFGHLVSHFRKCMDAAASYKGDIPPRTDPTQPAPDVPCIDVSGFDLGISADNMLALRVRATNIAIELRFPPESVQGLEKGVRDAVIALSSATPVKQ